MTRSWNRPGAYLGPRPLVHCGRLPTPARGQIGMQENASNVTAARKLSRRASSTLGYAPSPLSAAKSDRPRYLVDEGHLEFFFDMATIESSAFGSMTMSSNTPRLTFRTANIQPIAGFILISLPARSAQQLSPEMRQRDRLRNVPQRNLVLPSTRSRLAACLVSNAKAHLVYAGSSRQTPSALNQDPSFAHQMCADGVFRYHSCPKVR